MNKNIRKSSKTSYIITSIFLTIFLLFVIGSMSNIEAYDSVAPYATLKLFCIHIFVFTTMTVAIYFLIIYFLNKTFKQIFLMVGVLIISFWLSTHFINVADNQGKYVGLSYILVGDYLRDIHGINIYFMDWMGWAITSVLYLTSLISFLTLTIVKRVISILRK